MPTWGEGGGVRAKLVSYSCNLWEEHRSSHGLFILLLLLLLLFFPPFPHLKLLSKWPIVIPLKYLLAGDSNLGCMICRQMWWPLHHTDSLNILAILSDSKIHDDFLSWYDIMWQHETSHDITRCKSASLLKVMSQLIGYIVKIIAKCCQHVTTWSISSKKYLGLNQ